uniref:Uncharacterized protein n=1 Tax=Romanomermis culicivorax TaxID=13658 RepID=A0A915KDH9_ROMCU
MKPVDLIDIARLLQPMQESIQDDIVDAKKAIVDLVCGALIYILYFIYICIAVVLLDTKYKLNM